VKISDYTGEFRIIRDAEFFTMGYVNSDCNGVLAYADTLKYLYKAQENPGITCLITTSELASMAKNVQGLIVAKSPRDIFYDIHLQLIKGSHYSPPFKPGIGKGCSIHPTAIISEGCQIGNNVMIGEHVIIQSPTWIGSNVKIDAGVKIGVDGILYSMTSDGPRLIKHAGYVRIKDGAILMANSIIVRSIHNSDVTEIGRAALVGLGSIVGHEAKVGDHAIVSNQCVLARQSVLGARAFLGTHAMIKEYVLVGSAARVMAGSVVIENVKSGAEVSGIFATDHRSRMLGFSRLKHLLSSDDKAHKASGDRS
jgi:UDP-3-O-[3-hydroxymyristoyl] glucosamine N-acyltransferase